MDGQRFDKLTRVLAATESRRTLLKSLAGAVLGGLFGLPAATGEAAACRLIGQTCNANRRCCPGAACARPLPVQDRPELFSLQRPRHALR